MVGILFPRRIILGEGSRGPRGDMRLRFLPAFLLLCAVSLATAQGIGECREGADDELLWEYGVRRPHRVGGYQVRFTLHVADRVDPVNELLGSRDPLVND